MACKKADNQFIANLGLFLTTTSSWKCCFISLFFWKPGTRREERDLLKVMENICSRAKNKPWGLVSETLTSICPKGNGRKRQHLCSAFSISIKKSLLLVTNKITGIKAEPYSLGALLLVWRKVYFTMCGGFYWKKGNYMTKEMWKVFLRT